MCVGEVEGSRFMKKPIKVIYNNFDLEHLAASNNCHIHCKQNTKNPIVNIEYCYYRQVINHKVCYKILKKWCSG